MENRYPADASVASLVEGIAYVVAVQGNKVWLEPEQTASCGSCASSPACGAKGIGTVASRLEARRFELANPADLTVGERVVIGVREDALLKASMTAYLIPLGMMLGFGVAAQWAAGNDGFTMLAMLAGLVSGLGSSRLRAGRMGHQGDLTPRYLRRAGPHETCRTG
jgi:sigma-E factor negative regulatory protein RseC